jgi:hypothetical protein
MTHAAWAIQNLEHKHDAKHALDAFSYSLLLLRKQFLFVRASVGDGLHKDAPGVVRYRRRGNSTSSTVGTRSWSPADSAGSGPSEFC